jgi:hypothetical protein
MLRVLLKLLLAAAAIAAVWAFVPIGGRSMADRWRTATDPSEFVDRTWAELRGPQEPAQRTARRAPQGPSAPAGHPTESHRESDRKALERIVADRLEK